LHNLQSSFAIFAALQKGHTYLEHQTPITQ